MNQTAYLILYVYSIAGGSTVTPSTKVGCLVNETRFIHILGVFAIFLWYFGMHIGTIHDRWIDNFDGKV